MMKSKKTILIDTDALVRLTQINGVLNLMRGIYFRIEIPLKVKEEYANGAETYNPERILILNQLRPNAGFWSLCTQLNRFSQVILRSHKGIDEGEAELIAQGELKNIRIIVSDDGDFKKTAEALRLDNRNFLIVTSLFVFASLDINGFLPNKRAILQSYYDIRNFKSYQLREAYKIALIEYGIKWTNRKISDNTSLNKLGVS